MVERAIAASSSRPIVRVFESEVAASAWVSALLSSTNKAADAASLMVRVRFMRLSLRSGEEDCA